MMAVDQTAVFKPWEDSLSAEVGQVMQDVASLKMDDEAGEERLRKQ